jgi:hypothetical protein
MNPEPRLIRPEDVDRLAAPPSLDRTIERLQSPREVAASLPALTDEQCQQVATLLGLAEKPKEDR